MPILNSLPRRGAQPMERAFMADPVSENDREALVVLDQIVAEFESDPMSVQCFDLRIVERAKTVIANQKRFERSGRIPPLLTEGGC